MTHSQDDYALDPRAREVLRIIVEEHVKRGEPVSSRTTARFHTEKLSPATIRNIMAELTETGFLEQAHTSAGRVPTDKGYRQFVDGFLGEKRKLAPGEARRVREILKSSRELVGLLSRASHLLADLTHQVGLVLPPDLEKAELDQAEFLRIAPHRVVGVFISGSNLVTHRVIELEEDLQQEDLDRLTGVLREHFAGKTLPVVRAALIEALQEDERLARSMGRTALGAVRALLDDPFPGPEGELIVEGTSRLLDAPEFAKLDRLRQVLRTLEERTRLLRLLDRCLGKPGVQVIIGSEAQEPGMEMMAVVVCPFGHRESMKGVLGVVGPRRMEYARAVAVVDHLAQTMTEILSAGGEPGRREDR